MFDDHDARRHVEMCPWCHGAALHDLKLSLATVREQIAENDRNARVRAWLIVAVLALGFAAVWLVAYDARKIAARLDDRTFRQESPDARTSDEPAPRDK